MQDLVQKGGVSQLARRDFLSTYTHLLDPKRRLTIPSEWRDLFPESPTLYVLPDFFDPCLRLTPFADMEHRIAQMRQIPLSDQQGRMFLRELGRQSSTVQWDSQGRIRIKDEMLNWAGLIDQVVLIGAYDSFELWEPGNLAKVSAVAGMGDQERLREAAKRAGI